MCMIWRFIVMKNRTKKYMRRIGQKTGMSNTLKNVMKVEIAVPLAHANQNLNSGRRRANGLNSLPSLSVVGSDAPVSDGSSRGDRNAMKLLSKKIPKPYATMK